METKCELIVRCGFIICSYPTYEEWKLAITGVKNVDIKNRSYPTYEEWKLCIYKIDCGEDKTVLILPMRNGNSIPASSY